MPKKKRQQSLSTLLKTHDVSCRMREKGKCRLFLVHRKSGKPRLYTIHNG